MSTCDRVLARLRVGRRTPGGGDDTIVSPAPAAGPDHADARAVSSMPAGNGLRAHLASCPTCRDAAALLRLLGDTATPDDTDAGWRRLGERLARSEDTETVVLRRPPLGWRVALALAAGAGSFMLVPEPLQILMALGVL